MLQKKRLFPFSMGKSFWLCVLVSLTFCHSDRHVEAQSVLVLGREIGDDVRTQVDKLIDGLNSPQLAVREQAERDLVSLGPAILSLLEPRSQSSPEAALRLDRVRRTLIDQIVARDPLPTTVNCSVKGVPLSEVISQITKQTGNKVAVAEELAKVPVTWDCQDKTFWEAMDGLSALVNGELEPAGSNGLRIVPRRTETPPSVGTITYCGAFRVQLREYVKTERGSSDVSFITIDIMWEPRLQPAVIWLGQIAIDTGQSVTLKTEEEAFTRREIPVSPSKCSVSISVPMEEPVSPKQSAEHVKGVPVLRGSFEPVLPVGVLDVAFDMTTLRKGSRSLDLGQAQIAAGLRRADANVCEVVLRVRYEESFGAFASHRGWFYSWPIRLELGSETLLPKRVELLRMSEDGVELVYQFDTSGDSARRLICRVPVAIIRPKVEFQLALPPER